MSEHISKIDLLDVLASAESIAKSAGALLREAYDQPREIDFKGTVDLVTQADRAAESLILEALADHFPEHAVLAEESGSHDRQSSDYQWLVDPLDGTTNFAHGFPVFAVSMALRQQEELLVGVVYDPLRDESFTAVKGHGTTLNGRPVSVSQVSTLEQALLATGFPYNRHTAKDNNTMAFAAFLRRAQGMRRAGAAALDLAYVAAGRVDGYWEKDLSPWDIAAGILMVQEAGGRVTNYGGQAHTSLLLSGEGIIAANQELLVQMQQVLDDVYSD